MQAWWTAGTGTLTGDTWGWSCGGTEILLSRLSSLQAAAESPGCFPSGISPGIVAKDAVSGRTPAPATVPDGKINFLLLLCCTFSADGPYLGLYKPKKTTAKQLSIFFWQAFAFILAWLCKEICTNLVVRQENGPGYSAVPLTDKNGAESYIKCAAVSFIFLQVAWILKLNMGTLEFSAIF